jgi:hypothetical protein
MDVHDVRMPIARVRGVYATLQVVVTSQPSSEEIEPLKADS